MPAGASPAAGGHDHAGGAHAHHHPPGRRSPVRIGASVLRMSLTARLGLVFVLLAVLWTAVLLVTGGGA